MALSPFASRVRVEFYFIIAKNPKMDSGYTEDLRNRPEEHPETPIDAILILVRLLRAHV